MAADLAHARIVALTDPLTRIWNRAGAEEYVRRKHAQATAAGGSLAVAVIDIDHFKSVNDTYGHPAGDAVLREFCKRVLRALRPEDFFCRMGGEEFLIIIEDPDAATALELAQAVRREIRSRAIVAGDIEILLTASIGLAYYQPAVITSFDEAIRRADEALYAAKKAGRDRLIAYHESGEH
ncbi:MAG: GGDEF domain-containing protein [Leptospirales bacterium]